MDCKIIDNIRNLERSMRLAVKIPRDEVDRIVVSSLIKVRNSTVNKSRSMDHFDQVIRHYLTEDEFKKYVIDEVEIEF